MRTWLGFSVVALVLVMLLPGGCPLDLSGWNLVPDGGGEIGDDDNSVAGDDEVDDSVADDEAGEDAVDEDDDVEDDVAEDDDSEEEVGEGDETEEEVGEGDETEEGDSSDDEGDTADITINDEGEAAVEKFLPEVVSLDIDELPEDEEDEGAAKRQTASGPGPGGFNIYEKVVRSSATIVHRFHRFADRTLAMAAAIRYDMDDPNQTQVEGTFWVHGIEVAYKADFAAFDIDGDGTPDGSGNAIDEPVALRMWTDLGEGWQPFFCALVTARPGDDNLGAGRIYVHPDAADPFAPAGVTLFVEYDRTDDAHQWNQAWVCGQVHPLYGLHHGTARVDLRSSDEEGLEKTVRSASEFEENPYGYTTFQSAAHWLLGGEGLLMAAHVLAGGAEATFDSVCVDLETRELSEEACTGFDTQDMTLLEIPAGNETDLPEDFPAEPTF